MSQREKVHVHTHGKNRRRRGPSGWTFKVECSNSYDHVLKIADRLGCLGCLGCGVPIGRKNPRRRKIVKIPDSYDSKDKWEPGFSVFRKINLREVRNENCRVLIQKESKLFC